MDGFLIFEGGEEIACCCACLMIKFTLPRDLSYEYMNYFKKSKKMGMAGNLQ